MTPHKMRYFMMGEESINRTYHHFKHAVIFQEVWGILSLKQTLAKRNSFPLEETTKLGTTTVPKAIRRRTSKTLGKCRNGFFWRICIYTHISAKREPFFFWGTQSSKSRHFPISLMFYLKSFCWKIERVKAILGCPRKLGSKVRISGLLTLMYPIYK